MSLFTITDTQSITFVPPHPLFMTLLFISHCIWKMNWLHYSLKPHFADPADSCKMSSELFICASFPLFILKVTSLLLGFTFNLHFRVQKKCKCLQLNLFHCFHKIRTLQMQHNCVRGQTLWLTARAAYVVI